MGQNLLVDSGLGPSTASKAPLSENIGGKRPKQGLSLPAISGLAQFALFRVG